MATGTNAELYMWSSWTEKEDNQACLRKHVLSKSHNTYYYTLTISELYMKALNTTHYTASYTKQSNLGYHALPPIRYIVGNFNTFDEAVTALINIMKGTA